jgi:hypothetical protein
VEEAGEVWKVEDASMTLRAMLLEGGTPML